MSSVGPFAYGSAGGWGGVDLGEVPFVVMDVETTGLSSTSDRIVEIALVRVEGQIMTMQKNDVHAALLLTVREPVRCIDAVENDSRISGCGVAPWYYERAAIMFARLGDPAAEVAVLERFARQRHAPGAKPPQLLDRLRRLHAAATGG